MSRRRAGHENDFYDEEIKPRLASPRRRRGVEACGAPRPATYPIEELASAELYVRQQLCVWTDRNDRGADLGALAYWAPNPDVLRVSRALRASGHEPSANALELDAFELADKLNATREIVAILGQPMRALPVAPQLALEPAAGVELEEKKR